MPPKFIKSPPRCLRVGITGGIGSGKTMVCRIFQALGVPVYHADIWAKWLIQHDPMVRKNMIAAFGPEAFLPNGVYNKAFVSEIVFRDEEKLADLNAAVHPALEKHSREWHDEMARQGHAYSLKEAAVLVETGGHRYLDLLIVVIAPEDLRIERVANRDGLSEEAVRARIRNQLPDAEKVKFANFLLVNDGKRMLIPQVWAVHRQIMASR